MVMRRILLGLVLFLVVAPLAAAGDDKLNCRVFTEDPLPKMLSSSWVPGSIQLSPDNQNIAFIKLAGDKKEVVINDQTLATYDEIVDNRLHFSPDGSRLVFIIKQGGQYQVVNNGREGQSYQAIGPGTLIFSLEGGNFAYTAQKNGQWCVVFNETEGKKYDSIATNSLTFSNDGQRLIYSAQLGGKWFIVQDQQESKAYDGVRRVTLSPDGRHWAAIVRQGDKIFVEYDGVAGATYQMIKASSLGFSSDSKHLSYVVEQEGKQFAVIDGKEEKAYQAIGPGAIKFSPDGKQTVYSAQQDGKWLVVTNGKTGPHYDGIMEGTPVFSPDGTKVVYAAQLGQEWLMVVNGVEGEHYQAIGAGTICFSPNSKRLAYAVKAKGKWQVILDGQTGRFYDEIGRNSLKFNYDSDNLVFSAKRGSDWFVVLDGTEGRLYNSIINGENGAIFFDEPAYFNYFAISNSQLLWVEERVPNKQSFRDFRSLAGIHPELEQTTQTSNKTFTFSFNPPDGTTFVVTTKITDNFSSDFGEASTLVTEVKEKAVITRTTSGYQINWLLLSLTSSGDRPEIDPASLAAFQGGSYTYELDPQGRMIKITGIKELKQNLKTKLKPEDYNKYTENLNETMIQEEWKNNVEDLLGKKFQIGDVWQATNTIPLPDGEPVRVEVMARFAREVKQGVSMQFILKMDSKVMREFFQKELAKELQDAPPDISIEPVVELRGEGESIVDPATMLNYAEWLRISFKVAFEIPGFGKKGFAMERRIENTYEYSKSSPGSEAK